MTAEALGKGPIALDTAVFIYFIEENPAFLPVVEPIFQRIAAGEIEAVTSGLTLLETLVVPYRAGDLALAARYEALLTRSDHLTMIELDSDILRAAAQLRAHHRVKTPDAIQLAAALTERCTAFVTNDRDLPPIPGLKVLSLADRQRPRINRSLLKPGPL